MRIFIFILMTLFGATANSTGTIAAGPDVSTIKAQPKICVVLSGGGARGFAHIGVLKYLEELRIPVNCVTGTSMGAVVGGLYAAGMSASDIEKKLDAINLNNIALDVVDRSTISQALRQDDANYPISGTFGLSDKGISLPRGAVQANQFLELLQNWTAHLPPDVSFDQLAIPFRAVATDLETGDMVVFKQGPMATALRASTAVPGAFAPIEVNGHLLSDGGLVRNLPVDIAQEMGADIIIAVNIGTPLLPRNQLNNFFDFSQQMIHILTEQNVNEQKRLLKPSDILIDADLGTIRFMDFRRAKEAAEVGYKAAQRLHDKLAELSLTPEDYQTHAQTRPNPSLPEVKIAFVDVRVDRNIPADDIRRQLNIPIGSVYDTVDINKRITTLVNTRQYESIVQNLIHRDGDYGVEVDATALGWGPNFLRFGLELTSSLNRMSGFEFQVGHRLPWINASGLEWRNDFQFGNVTGIRSELRQPLFTPEGMYIAPFVDFKLKTLSLYFDNDRIADYSVQSSTAGVDLGIPLGTYSDKGEIRTGLFATKYSSRPKLGGIITQLPDGDVSITSLASEQLDEIGFHSRFIVDQLDAPYFPSTGYRIGGEFIAGLDRTSSNMPSPDLHEDFRGYQQLTFDTKWAKSIGNNSVNLSLQAGARSQSGPSVPGIGLTLGGFQQLTAYQPDQFFGKYLLYGNATYLFRAVNFDMFDQAIFMGTSLEIGNASDARSDFSLRKTKKSLSIFAGAQTFMGPVYFGLAAAPGGVFNLFLQMGRQ